MRPRYEQNVAGQKRASIEKCDPRWIIEDDLGGCIAADDCAEDTPVTAGARLELDVEDHGVLSRDVLLATRRNR